MNVATFRVTSYNFPMVEKALQPVEQKTIVFYDDEITAVLAGRDEQRQVFVPVRPLCDFLGVSWTGQRRRINRDPVLAEVLTPVNVTFTGHAHGKSQTVVTMCLPLEFLNGWLFGINASRVKPEVREQLIRYQRECYRVLADAFGRDVAAAGAETTTLATLSQVREMGLAIARMAEEQMEFERRLGRTEGRLDQAAVVVADINKRLTAVEKRIAPGQPVTEEQASHISQAVKAVAVVLGQQSGRNEFGGVYGELYRRFEITSYKQLPAGRYQEALTFLTDWYRSLTDADDIPF